MLASLFLHGGFWVLSESYMADWSSRSSQSTWLKFELQVILDVCNVLTFFVGLPFEERARNDNSSVRFSLALESLEILDCD